MRETLGIIIPVWGEKELVSVLYNRLITVMKQLPVDYRLIYVDDACPFGSGEELDKLAKIDKNINVIHLSRNFGEAVAVKVGIDNCDTDWAVVMDCDLQDRPEDIISFFNKAKEGYDIVWGERICRKDSFSKKFCSNFFYLINNILSENKVKKKIGSFSIISRKVVNELKKINTYTFNYIQMVEFLGFKKAYIPIVKSKRELGKSGYNFIKGTCLALNIMVSTSNRLLLLPIITSAILFIICFLYAFIQIFNKNILTSEYNTLIFIVLFLFCCLFLNLSILGIYMGIILKEVLRKPHYVINKRQEIIE